VVSVSKLFVSFRAEPSNKATEHISVPPQISASIPEKVQDRRINCMSPLTLTFITATLKPRYTTRY